MISRFSHRPWKESRLCPCAQMKPLCIDLFCGLGGWAEGFLAEGWDVIGFDIERHDYGTGGYPGQLVLQDVCSLEGRQLAEADLIVASSPCQEFSYRAMPWKRAKLLGPPVLGIKLFWQAFRLQLEISEATGRRIPLVAENVQGAEKWVGPGSWKFGSYYLWGDVPLLMPPIRGRDGQKGFRHNGIRDPSWPHNQVGGSLASKIPFPLAQHIARVYKPDIPQRRATPGRDETNKTRVD
jgi:C-5 cytosine-specific DNA methylase